MNLRQIFTANPWWGKFIGAILGFLIGGPAGALFGLLIGNFFDRGLAEHLSQASIHNFSEIPQNLQHLFVLTTFSVMGHIAKADGRVSEQEIKMAKILMSEMKLNASEKKEAELFFKQGKNVTFNLQSTLSQFKDAMLQYPFLIKKFVDIQYKVAQIEFLSEKKLQIINSILQQLGFVPLHQQHRFYDDFGQKTQYQRSTHRNQSYSSHPQYKQMDYLTRAFALLQITPNASQQEVKRAYRRLISKNHPDKLIAKGSTDAAIKEANDKTQRIRKAYELICSNKGWSK